MDWHQVVVGPLWICAADVKLSSALTPRALRGTDWNHGLPPKGQPRFYSRAYPSPKEACGVMQQTGVRQSPACSANRKSISKEFWHHSTPSARSADTRLRLTRFDALTLCGLSVPPPIAASVSSLGSEQHHLEIKTGTSHFRTCPTGAWCLRGQSCIVGRHERSICRRDDCRRRLGRRDKRKASTLIRKAR
jgi:hypothetical protein